MSLALSLAAASSAAALTGPSPAGAVAGGTGAADGAYPFVVKVQVAQLRGCTGVLVAPQWVVTSRECFSVAGEPVTETPPPTLVTLGRTNLAASGGHVLGVTKLVPRDDRDVVLAKLARRVTDVTPATVATSPAAEGDALRLAGFGRTATDWVPDHLQTAVAGAGTPTATTLGFSPAPGVSACKGDAGAPLFPDSGDHPVVGLVSASWQGGCLDVAGETRTTGVAARLDDLGGWIATTTRDLPLSDLDGDGRADLVGRDASGVLWWGRGGGPAETPELAAKAQIATGWGGVRDVLLADLDGDGRSDVVGRTGDTLKVWRSTGSSPGQVALAEPATLGTGWDGPARLAAADADDDGRTDVLGIDTAGTLWWGRNTTVGGTPTAAAKAAVPGVWSGVRDVGFADLDGDGRSDVLGRTGDTLKVWRGTGTPGQAGFAPDAVELGTGWGVLNRLATVDLDGDDRTDVIGTDEVGTLSWARNTTTAGVPALAARTQVSVGWGGVRDLMLADLDGDRRSDVVGRTGDTLQLWRSTGPPGQATLTGPARLGTGWGPVGGRFVDPGPAVHVTPTGQTASAFYRYDRAQTKLWRFDNLRQPPVNTALTWDSGLGNWDGHRAKNVAGDFDADGRPDAVAFYNYDGGGVKLWSFMPLRNGTLATGLVWDSGPGNWDWNRVKAVTGDFTGDGKDDVGVFYNYGGGLTRLFVADDIAPGRVFWRTTWDSGPGNWDWNRMKLVTGDFNGDGKDDIGAFYNYDGGGVKLWVTYDAGSAASWQVVWDSGPGNWDWNRVKAVTGDFTGDGKDDAGVFYNYGGGVTRLFVADDVNPGGVFWRTIWDSAGGWDWNRMKTVTGDFNADGKDDIGAFYNYDAGGVKLWLTENAGSTSANWRVGWDSGPGNWDWNRLDALRS